MNDPTQLRKVARSLMAELANNGATIDDAETIDTALDRAAKARQEAQAEAEAAGLAFAYWTTPRPIVSWTLQADLFLAVDRHIDLTLEQAIKVQQLFESFEQQN